MLASTVCGFPSAAHADNTVELVLSQGVESVNEPFAVSGMLPGDCESIDIIVEVRHMEALSVAFEAEVAGEPVALSDALELRVVDRVEGTVLYEGTIAALDAHPLSVDLPKKMWIRDRPVTGSTKQQAGGSQPPAFIQVRGKFPSFAPF